MVEECPGLLFQFPESAFNSEAVTVKSDNRQGIQTQVGACQDTLYAIHFYQHKT